MKECLVFGILHLDDFTTDKLKPMKKISVFTFIDLRYRKIIEISWDSTSTLIANESYRVKHFNKKHDKKLSINEDAN